MTRHRVAALLSLLLFGQLSLFGGGSLCAPHAGSLAAAKMLAASGHSQHTPPPRAPRGHHDQQHGGAPQCTMAASCTVTAVTTAPVMRVTSGNASTRRPWVSPALASVTFAPELPPPRG